LAELCPFNFEKMEIFSSHSLLPQQLYMYIFNSNERYDKNALVNFEFGHGLMIADRVIPLEL
jgi:hypothetical protein